MDKDMKDGCDEHEVKSAMETLMRAEEIKENSKLHAAVQEKMSKHMGHMKKLAGGKKKPQSIDELRAMSKEVEKKEKA